MKGWKQIQSRTIWKWQDGFFDKHKSSLTNWNSKYQNWSINFSLVVVLDFWALLVSWLQVSVLQDLLKRLTSISPTIFLNKNNVTIFNSLHFYYIYVVLFTAKKHFWECAIKFHSFVCSFCSVLFVRSFFHHPVSPI